MGTGTTKHHQALEQVIANLRGGNAECALLLTGSVLRGTEHPGSDIDLFAVVPSVDTFKAGFGEVVHSTDHVRVVQARWQDIPVTVTCCDAHLLQSMACEAWRNYLFAKAKILCDPLGLACKAQQDINGWFAANPAVETLWTQQAHEHAKCKAARRQGHEVSLKFPSWDAFADHIDDLVKRDAVPRAKGAL